MPLLSMLECALIAVFYLILFENVLLSSVQYNITSVAIIHLILMHQIMSNYIIIFSTLCGTPNCSYNIESQCVISQWHFKGSTSSYRHR